MTIPTDQRSPEQQVAVFDAWRRTLPAAKALNAEAEALWKTWPAEPRTSVLHLAERRDMDARSTHLLDRGVWNQPKHAIPPHVPAALHPLSTKTQAHRLAFARWLVDSQHPLTARRRRPCSPRPAC